MVSPTTDPGSAVGPATDLQMVTVPVPRVYSASTTHRRNSTAPGSVTRTFRYRTSSWLIDVDDPPRLPRVLGWLVRFEARDHLGDPAGTIAGNARAALTERGLTADQILLLTCPRVGGHVFNPLSVFYCFATDAAAPRTGRLVAVIAEVHNTYGGRHVYVLQPDEAGRDSVDKQFYVSPFLPMGGRYLMRTPVPGDRLAVSIALQQDGGTPFVATLTGRGTPITTRSALTALVRRPMVTLRTSALIRWQGIRLWLRRVPVQPRPADAVAHEHGR